MNNSFTSELIQSITFQFISKRDRKKESIIYFLKISSSMMCFIRHSISSNQVSGHVCSLEIKYNRKKTSKLSEMFFLPDEHEKQLIFFFSSILSFNVNKATGCVLTARHRKLNQAITIFFQSIFLLPRRKSMKWND